MSRLSFDRSGAAPAVVSHAENAAGPAAVRWTRRGLAGWIIPLGVGACYVAFAVAVHLRLLDSLDVKVRAAAYPGEVWGEKELRAAQFVRVLKPAHLALPLLLVVVGVSVMRRSFRPVWAAVLVGLPVLLVTVGTKWIMRRLDPSIYPVGHGSFPSGHVVSATMACGLAVLIALPGTRWGWLLPAAMGCSMGTALVVGQVHPVSDVIGAGLLCVAALTGATAARLGRWAGVQQRGNVG
jgi:hypothetical protein